MKKLFKSLFVIVAATVAFAGCAKQEIENPSAAESKTVKFFAESIETKTHFGDKNDDGKYPTLWDEGDKVKVFLNLPDVAGTQNSPTVEVKDEGVSASFIADITDPETDEYTFYAVVPADRYNAKSSNEGRFTVQIPSAQEPQSNSVDKAAQVLYAISETTNSFPENVQLDFKHFTAYGKLSLTNLSNTISSISSITLEFDGVSLAGKWNYFVEDGSVSVKEEDAKLVLTTSVTENIWFACAPVDVSGKELTLTVNTDKGPLERMVTFPENCKFEAGKISTFTINMAGIEPTVSDEEWVTTAFADLKSGDQVVIVSTKESSIWALSDANGTSKAPAGELGVTYANDKLSAKPNDDIIWYVGVDDADRIFYADSDMTTWLYCTDTNNGVRVGTEDNKLFSFTNNYLYNKATSRYVGVYTTNPDWRCYTSINNNIKDQTFQFFVKSNGAEDEGGEEPDTTPRISVSSTALNVDADAETVEFTYTLHNVDDTPEVTVADGATMTNVEATAADGTVTVTFEANTEKVEKTATLVLSIAGAEDVEVVITQAAYVEPGEGGETTVEMTSFTATAANIDEVISYTTAKGGGTANPAINGGVIRLYQNSEGTGGGTITIKAADGYTLSSVTIGSSMTTSIAYTIEESTTKSQASDLDANGKYTVDDINASSITFYCMGTSSSSRLYVNYLSATYTN